MGADTDLVPVGNTIADLDDLLLEAKISIPAPPQRGVSRRRLIDLARSSGRRVVGVTAPAGYGKSTLLAEWAHLEDRPVAWVSLDRLDDDPDTLLAVLRAAYGRISPENIDLMATLTGRGAGVLGRAAPRFATALSMARVPFVLMLDDLHELATPGCQDVLEVLIAGIPEGSQVVAASRFEQPHLPRLRASGQAFELESSDLALDAAAAEHIFAEAHVKLSPERVAEVTARTEGWPVGLYLASLIARDGDSDATISGDDRYVADYLYREALSQLPEKEQRFLRRTAVLDQLNGPLCEAVVGDTGGLETLRRLESSGSFLISLDRRREWYRSHALFREFLLAELRSSEPDAIPKLHLRAADWYESNGSPVLALEHLLNTDERDRSVQLLCSLVRPTYNAGHLPLIERWLRSIGDAAIREHPPLAVLAGWVAVLTGQTFEAHRWASVAEGTEFSPKPTDGTASFESGRAILRAALCSSGPDQMLADAAFALARETPWGGWRETAQRVCAEALLLTGDFAEAAELFTRASAEAGPDANPDGLVLSAAELALLAMDGRRWDEAAKQVDRALAVIDEHGMQEYPMSVIAFAAAARLAVQRCDLNEASRHLVEAMRARPALTSTLPYLAVRARLHLARVYFALQDPTTARHLMREIEDVLLLTPDLGLLVDEVLAFQAKLSGSGPTNAPGASPLTPAELRLLPYLQTHLTIRQIAERLFVSRNTVNSEIGSIYRKLGVSSRSEAVEQATATGLLGG